MIFLNCYYFFIFVVVVVAGIHTYIHTYIHTHTHAHTHTHIYTHTHTYIHIHTHAHTHTHTHTHTRTHTPLIYQSSKHKNRWCEHDDNWHITVTRRRVGISPPSLPNGQTPRVCQLTRINNGSTRSVTIRSHCRSCPVSSEECPCRHRYLLMSGSPTLGVWKRTIFTTGIWNTVDIVVSRLISQ